jgi:hypothetical protein
MRTLTTTVVNDTITVMSRMMERIMSKSVQDALVENFHLALSLKRFRCDFCSISICD